MILVNGANGIGTGYSTFVPSYNPKDIVKNIKRIMDGKKTKRMVPWYYGFTGKIEKESSNKFMATGVYFIILMVLSFIVAYGLILKKRFAPFLGFGKGMFLIFYFLYSVLDFRRLALEAEITEVRFFSDLLETEKQVYLANMYVNIALLLFVLVLTLAMLYILFKDGHLNKIFKRGTEPQSANETKLSVINDKLESPRVPDGEGARGRD